MGAEKKYTHLRIEKVGVKLLLPTLFGGSAIHYGPVALRHRITPVLPLSESTLTFYKFRRNVKNVNLSKTCWNKP